MKKLLTFALVLHAACFTAAAFAYAAGFVSFNVLSPGGITGAVVIAVVLLFAWADYRRKPSFRVRRSAQGVAADVDPRPAGPGPDWTYTTRTK
jgi:hypothetical protein